MTLYHILSEKAHRTPQKVAIIQGQRRITYEELNTGTGFLASFLVELGIHPGDRVAIFSDNCPEYVMSYLGVQKAGAIAVDINPQYAACEVKRLLHHSLSSMLIVGSKFYKTALESVQEAPYVKSVIVMNDREIHLLPADPGRQNTTAHVSIYHFEGIVKKQNGCRAVPPARSTDIASIVYTSGTTGVPKGVMLSHENLMSNAESIVEYLRLTDKDIAMVVLPFQYSYGKSILNTHIMAGGTMVLEDNFVFPNIILKRMVEEGVTGFAGVPSTFSLLLGRSDIRQHRFPKLRYVTQAGGHMPPKHARELSEILPGVRIYIMYGQTEATARLTYLEPESILEKPGSIGRPIPGVSLEIIKDDGEIARNGEEGEIVARGKNVMIGYWNNPEETRKVLREGKLYTGDIARMDDDGYLYIVGRRSDIIKSGAHRISPQEIEEAILEMEGILEVCVVGIPDAMLGEKIRAVIVPRKECTVDVNTVKRHCQNKLAKFMIPHEVLFVDELPKTSSAKVRRSLLRNDEAIMRTSVL